MSLEQDILYLTSPAFMCRRERLLGNVGKLTYNLNVMPCGANRRNKEATMCGGGVDIGGEPGDWQRMLVERARTRAEEERVKALLRAEERG